ncbi:AAA family ATPase [Comamonas serinivorans]|nr:AAA family ATPase [Comamonas serinivorans]
MPHESSGPAARPRRIVIIGRPGSGKSTLARRLGERLNLPVVHLDRLFWLPGWTQPDEAAFRARVQASTEGPGWISEGNYDRTTFALRLPLADALIWLDPPRSLCLWRVIARNRRGGRRPDLPEGCEERLNAEFLAFLRYVWRYDRDHRPRIEVGLAQHGRHLQVHRLNSDAAVKAFWAAL